MTVATVGFSQLATLSYVYLLFAAFRITGFVAAVVLVRVVVVAVVTLEQ